MNSSITSRGIQNTATRRSSEKKHTRLTNNQDFTMKALSKQNTEALLASLSCSSFQAATERSAIFAFGVWLGTCHDSDQPLLAGIDKVNKPIKILGVHFTYDLKKKQELNYDDTLRASPRIFRLQPCRIEKSKIAKLCRDKGLLKSFTEIYVSVCLDKYFTGTATF